MFLNQFAQWPLLATCARGLFRGGVGHCQPPPTRHDFPVEIRDGYVHFFQNPLGWDQYAESVVPKIMATLLFMTLSAEERRHYDFAVHPGDARRDFLSFCVAFIRNDKKLINYFYSKHGKFPTLQRLEVIESLFDMETLGRRAHRVHNVAIIV